ncbi:MAG TPA: 16S rRNA (uracil(1498)-N(3))-methyltransferase [bacterium]|nr:16S rRNA (uracil(1498)-N(3))-methyltransferase [bacterium]
MNTRVFTAENLSLKHNILLDESESHYFLKVMRSNIGETVELFSDENFASAKFTGLKNKLPELEILNIKPYYETFPKISVFQCFPESAKSELAVQKLTELGIDEIIFLESENSITISSNKKLKLIKVLREAVRQSKRYSIPVLKFDRLNNFINSISKNCESPQDTKNIILEPTGKKLSNLFEYSSFKQINLIVGPEKGFSASELNSFSLSGGDLIKINNNILRTETAVISAASIFGLLKSETF